MSAPEPIYLDHNATTPILPEVLEAMLPYLREHFGNPSSGHVYGRRAREGVDHAREQVAGLIGAAPDEIVFTSGGTEANNLAIQGLARAARGRTRIVTSAVEHPATARPLARLEGEGWSVARAPVDGTGRTRLDELLREIDYQTLLVTVMHSNNETGTIQPIAEIAAAARARGIRIHTDAAQSAGKVPLDVDVLGLDLLSIAGHKLYAPKGVGALYIRRGTPIEPYLLGASHERGLRPGTENVASIVALGMAAEIASRDLETESVRVRDLRDRFEDLLRRRVPGLELNGHPSERLPNTLNARFPRCRGSALLASAPEVAASTGSACHDGGESPSAVLTAMGIPPEEALGSVRLTLGRKTTLADIEIAAASLATAWERVTAAA